MSPRIPLEPDDPEIRRITARIEEIRTTLSRDNVETIREWGVALAEAASKMRHKDYQLWIARDLHISRAAAANYRRLYSLSVESPALFLRWKSIGPSKLYQLARLGKVARQAALKDTVSGRSVDEMTDAEFAVLMSRHKDPSRRRVTPKMRAHGLRMRIRTMLTDLDEAHSIAPLPADTRTKLTADLTALARAAAALLAHVRKAR
jgi:hypothetical protein